MAASVGIGTDPFDRSSRKILSKDRCIAPSERDQGRSIALKECDEAQPMLQSSTGCSGRFQDARIGSGGLYVGTWMLVDGPCSGSNWPLLRGENDDSAAAGFQATPLEKPGQETDEKMLREKL